MSKGIYCYIDKLNNEIVYIGKDSNINKKNRHKAHLRKSKYDEQQINRVIQKNPNRYRYKVLKEGNLSNKKLNLLEIEYIEKYNPKFNFTKGGEGVLGYKHKEVTKNKISKSMKGKKNFLGKTHSKETKDKISKKLSKAKSKTGYYRVFKQKSKTCKQGFIWVYKTIKDKKKIKIYSTNLNDLEKKVIERGFEWRCFNE